MIVGNPMMFSGAGEVPATPVIDLLGVSASVAYSLRRLRAAYSGSCIRVRRSSDNAEADIGFTSGGHLDTVALSAHVGAGAGFVTTFYDQTTGARNLTQPTAANQPRIMASGVFDTLTPGRAGIDCNGTTQMLLGAAFTINQPFSRSGVVKFTSVASGGNVYSDGLGNSLYFSAAGTLATYAGATTTVKTGVAADTVATVLEIINGGSSEGRFNGAAAAMSQGSTFIARTNLGGAYQGTVQSSWQRAIFSEHIIFPSLLSAGNRTFLEADQKTYWGTP